MSSPPPAQGNGRDSVTAADDGVVLTGAASGEAKASSVEATSAKEQQADSTGTQHNGVASEQQGVVEQAQYKEVAESREGTADVNGQKNQPFAAADKDAPQSTVETVATSADQNDRHSNGADEAANAATTNTATPVNADAKAESASSGAAAAAAAAAAHKKFTSLNVTKQFLQKASPTLAPAAVSPYGKLGATTLSASANRLSTSMQPSRLTAAKLSGTSKPASPGWASVTPAAGTASGADPSPAGAAGTPRLAAFARSTSPHVTGLDGAKGSPGLRNASLANRSSSPGTAAQGGHAPWAAVKRDGVAPRASTRMSEFPTTAELARAKQAAEEKEKQQAAQAAARSERALQNLDSFRGTHLGSGSRWDDMEDDDFGETLEFGDGTQYKVPVREEVAERSRTPITKEERFKDVSHDRSWPPRNGAQEARRPPTSRVPTNEQPRQASSSKPSRAETMAVHSGEGVSLTAAPSERPAWGPPRERGPPASARRDRDEGHGAQDHPAARQAAAQAAPAVSNVRAWGPLAQRQAALNPNTPKPVVPVPQAVSPVAAATRQQAPAKAASPQAVKPAARQVDEKRDIDVPPARRPSIQQTLQMPAQAPTSPSAATARPVAARQGPERGLPPHLAARQAQGAAPPRPMLAERPDWENAAPKVIDEPPAKQVRPSPFGAARSSAQDVDKVQSPELPEAQRGEMLSAAERARRRRQQEEEERAKERERALAKADAIEAKMQRQRESEEEKKKAEAEKRQAQKEQQQRKQAEQREAKAAKGERRDAAAAVETMRSPGDEADTWRRVHALPAAVAAPRPTPPADSLPGSARSTETVSSGPQRILLRRPEPVKAQEPARTIDTAQKQAPAQKAVQIPTGPRASRQADENVAPPKGPRAAIAKDSPAPIDRRAPRVEILAPTDKGASQHSREQEKGRRARQEAGPSVSPVSAMKQPTLGKRAPVIHIPKAQPLQSKTEVEFDPPPVWNKFKVKVGTSKPRERLPRHEYRAQQERVALAKSETKFPSAPELLSWNPPIANLPTRTLSRDDMLFPKKYRKGVVISTVSLPKMSMAELAVQRKATRKAQKAEAKIAAASNRANTTTDSDESLKAPLQSSAHTKSEQSGTSALPSRGARADTAFAQAQDPLGYSQTSPASFLLSSDISNERSGKPPVSSAAAQQRSLIKPSPALPSPSRMASTWGQSSLTFAGLQPEASEPTGDEQNHIKSMWAQSPLNPKGQAMPSQNSLRGIADELPAVMSMSMQDLRTEDGPSSDSVRVGQYQDVGINTASSAPISRVYSPLAQSKVTNADGVGSSSSPLDVQSSSNEAALNEELERSISRARSQSPSQGRYGSNNVSSSMSFPNQNVFLQQDKGGASAAFGPYAYPNTPAGYQAMQNALAQQQMYAKAGYGSNRSAGYFGNDGSQYGAQRNARNVNALASMQQAAALNGYNSRMSDYNAFSPGLSDMSAAALGAGLSSNSFSSAGWPLDSPGSGYGNGSGFGSNAFSSPASSYGQQQAWAAAYRQAQGYPHGRTSSSGYGQQQYPRAGYGQQQSGYGGMQSAANRGNGFRGMGQYDAASGAMAAATPSGMQASAKPFRYGSATPGRSQIEGNGAAMAGAAGYGGANGGNATTDAVAGMNGTVDDGSNASTGTASNRVW